MTQERDHTGTEPPEVKDSTAEFEEALARRMDGQPPESAGVDADVKDSTAEFEAALAGQDSREYVLRLYVTGTTPRSRRAIENLRRICDEHLQGRCRLEVVDVYQQPELAGSAHIVAVPTLIKQLPLPLRRFIGDLSDQERILAGLEIKPAPEADAE